MQYNLFSQILCKNQFSFFGSCVYKTYFNNSDESITWVPKIIENAFINLNQVWNSRLWFSSWGFNFQLEDSLSNSGLQFFNLMSFLQFFNVRIFWTWGFSLELWASILNVRIQFWIWGFDLELQAWIFELEDSILNLKIRSWTPGSHF